MAIYFLFSVSLFLFLLIGFLRGSAKQTLESIFLLLMLVLVGFGIYANGWFSIVIFIGIWLLGGNFVIGPISKVVARRLLTYPDLGYEDCSERRLVQTMAEFGSEAGLKRQEQRIAKESQQKDKMISSAMNMPSIVTVLSKFNATEQDLAALHDCATAFCSLPTHVRKIIVENPILVEFYLKHSSPCNAYDGAYGRELSRDASIRLILWMRNNPGGDEPHARLRCG